MNKDEYLELIEEKLSTFSEAPIELSYQLYKIIEDAPKDIQTDIFAHVCKLFGTMETDKSGINNDKYFFVDDEDELKKSYGDLIDELLFTVLKKAIKAGYDENQFYLEVWTDIVCNSSFKTEKEKVFAMYYIIIDKKIPYFKIKAGLTLDDKVFKKLIMENFEVVQKIVFILYNEFEQKTQRASNLLDVILEQESYELQVILLSVLLDIIKHDKEELSKDIT